MWGSSSEGATHSCTSHPVNSGCGDFQRTATKTKRLCLVNIDALWTVPRVKLMRGTKGGVISFMWTDLKSSKETEMLATKSLPTAPPPTHISWNTAANRKVRKEQERKHIVLKSVPEAKVSCMNHNIGFQRCCGAPVQNALLVQQRLGSVKKSADLEMNREILSAATNTFSLFHQRWPWIHSSLLVSGLQRLQRESCDHFGFATDHLTLGRPACGEL